MATKFLCRISGEACADPVVSPSGYIYERKYILASLDANEGKETLSGQQLFPSQLIPLQSVEQHGPAPSLPHRTPAAMSFPQILQLAQAEWDALVLEAFDLRQQLIATRSELARTLHRHDAACAVIARLLKEKDEAGNPPSSASIVSSEPASTNSSTSSTSSDSIELIQDISGLPDVPFLQEPLLGQINAAYGEFVAQRMQKSFLPEGPSSKHVKAYAPVLTLKPSLQSTAFSVEKTAGLIAAVGSASGAVQLLPIRPDLAPTDPPKPKPASKPSSLGTTFSAHQSAVTALQHFGTEPLLLSGSSDATVRLWKPSAVKSAKPKATRVFAHHQSPIISLAVHPTGLLFSATSEDGHWSLSDVESGAVVGGVKVARERIRLAAMHPDGNLMATASQQALRVWDLRANQRPLAALEQWRGQGGGVEYGAAVFSDNGYHFVSGQTNGRLALWDLRSSEVLHSTQHPSAVASVGVDPSAQFLAAAVGQNVAVYRVMSRKCRDLVTLSGNIDVVLGVEWVLDQSDRQANPLLVTLAADSTVRVWNHALIQKK